MNQATANVPLHEVDTTLTEQDFAALAALVQRHLGIRMPPEKRSLVVQRMRAPVAKSGCRSFGEWAHRHLTGALTPEVLSLLADALTTNHTAFWREPAHFEHLRDVTLPALLASRAAARDVRLWCAAAATGEEPWQLAMLLRDVLPTGWTGGLLATDVSAKALATATEGRYDEARLRSLPAAWRKRWIDPVPGGGRIQSGLRADVTFRRLNLLQGPWSFKKPFDVIFCRNVLIYFEPPVRDAVVTNLVGCLAPGGTLYVGHSESLPPKWGLVQLGTSTWQRPGGAR